MTLICQICDTVALNTKEHFLSESHVKLIIEDV